MPATQKMTLKDIKETISALMTKSGLVLLIRAYACAEIIQKGHITSENAPQPYLIQIQHSRPCLQKIDI